jgi:exodeoxyribonuclease VII small subunit
VSEETAAGDRTYESATARLDEIIHRLDSGEAQLRETLELCEEAKGLIEYCAGELAAVDQGLKELKLEELASSLSGTGAQPGDETAPEPPLPPAPDSDVPF